MAVTFFDVGQGDAALLRTAEGAAVLFDTGPNARIVQLLRREGVSRIDLLVVSHPHSDHTGGLAAVLKSFPVAQTWHAGGFRGGAGRALGLAHAVRQVDSRTVLRIGGLSLAVLHPPAGAAPAGNDGSLVVKAVYGGSRYLFPGDCEGGCWERIFRSGADLRADVLKAAHHGSWDGASSGVLGRVRPRVVVISCGRENRYGHPHPVVLKLLGKIGAAVFRTDRQGAIRCAGVECRAGPLPLESSE